MTNPVYVAMCVHIRFKKENRIGPSKCYQSQSRPVTCTTGCIDGYKGTFGNYCNETCSTGCLPGKSTCDRDGRCTVGCINGRYGNNCDGKCSTGCYNGTCNRNDGSCIYGCISGKSGPTCTNDCSKNCIICSQNENKKCSQCFLIMIIYNNGN
ncbi:hypothetical protein LOTGIDRAFT_166398 [Lottia gigantea]|uniref:EGF-like domain-containing protein n=1 Tax=Lottia gigantea TaxID=225164 RepID=V3ZT35_LOTGI|nr:hypothetical protein LOTGIDRAFT_166398 [Lottia gigantea]ESO87517.1 hypothetical protein LOTGIDRAFT_166398 [Lottia gigantea]